MVLSLDSSKQEAEDEVTNKRTHDRCITLSFTPSVARWTDFFVGKFSPALRSRKMKPTTHSPLESEANVKLASEVLETQRTSIQEFFPFKSVTKHS